MRWRGIIAAGLCMAAQPALSQTYGVAVQVSNGFAAPSQEQLQQVLRPGDLVRDMLSWQKTDPHCDLVAHPHPIQIPAAMAILYQRVAAAGGKNFVTLGFNNPGCGQPSSAGGSAFPDSPALRAEFAAYAAAVVRQVPALGGISIWNELSGAWGGGYTSEAQKLQNYCQLSNAVIDQIRQDNPKIPIAIGASLGWNVEKWFTGMFDRYGCAGKADPTIWLDVHPYLNGATVPHTGQTNFLLWRAALAAIRGDGIANPLIATEWGAKAANAWIAKHPGGDYIATFQSEVLAQDPHWAAAIWYEALYEPRSPNAGLFAFDGNLTPLGVRYVSDIRNGLAVSPP